MLSDRLWRRRFAADQEIVGKQARLDGELYTVIGVMPAAFENVPGPIGGDMGAIAVQPRTARGRTRVGPSSAHDCAREERCDRATGCDGADLETCMRMHAAYAKGYDSTGGAPDGMVVHPMQHDLTQECGPRCWRSLARCCWCCSSPASMWPICCWRAAGRARSSPCGPHWARRRAASRANSSPSACFWPRWAAR